MPLDPGTYWLTLQNALSTQGNPIYWDENSGPSLAQENSLGTIPSESFSIQGTFCVPVPQPPPTAAKAVTRPPSPTQNYRIIYNFTGAGDGYYPTSGLALDAAGNLYGITPQGGPSGAGTVFKLTAGASGWRFTRLYSFSGADDGAFPNTLMIGPDGRLYGAAGGGNSNNGVLFGLSPAANMLPSVFSNWMETLLYRFTGGSDGVGPYGNLVLDGSGNIYGTANRGGVNQQGTLYEFTNGGMQVLHAFPAFDGDGANPIGVVQGSNGLYGITQLGGVNAGGTFYTTAGGYQVLHSFTGSQPEGSPTGLAADSAGNLYGASTYINNGDCGYLGSGTSVYQLSPPDWTPSILNDTGVTRADTLTSSIATDGSGNIFGTISAYGTYGFGNVFKLSCCWNYTDLHDFDDQGDGWGPYAAPVVDAHGNVYGTTQYGGLYGYGTVSGNFAVGGVVNLKTGSG